MTVDKEMAMDTKGETPRRSQRKKAAAAQSGPGRKSAPAAKTGPGRKNSKVKYPAKGKKRKKSRYASIAALVAYIFFAAAVVVFGANLFGYLKYLSMARAVGTDHFYEGVTVDGEDVSGYTLEGALAAFGEKDEKKRAGHSVILTIEDESYTISPETLNYQSDYEAILKSAWSVGRYGTLSQRFEEVSRVSGVWARDYQVHSGFDEDALLDTLDDIATKASEPGMEAKIIGFDTQSKGFTFQEGKDGYIVDAHDLYDQVTAKMEAGGGAMTVARTRIDHGESVESLQAQFGMIANALTVARDDSDNRMANLRTAAKTINGMCIQPGQVFSMNQALGKRTRAKGYKAAGALENGVHTTQIGGGVCQISSTLFNAVGRADLEIVERYPHSIPSTYVALGRDATINWPNQDFRWRNNTDYPIYIVAGVNKKKQVIVQLYGKKRTDGITVKLEGVKNTTFSPKDPTYVYTSKLPTGERRTVEAKRKGYIVTTYRVYYKDDKEIKKEELFKSYYAPAGAIIEIGK